MNELDVIQYIYISSDLETDARALRLRRSAADTASNLEAVLLHVRFDLLARAGLHCLRNQPVLCMQYCQNS